MIISEKSHISLLTKTIEKAKAKIHAGKEKWMRGDSRQKIQLNTGSWETDVWVVTDLLELRKQEA